MGVPTDLSSDHAAALLACMGYAVARPPAGTINRQRACDLDARIGDERVLIEVKTFGLSDDQRRRLREEGAVQLGGALDRSRHMHAKLSDGASQLEASSVGGAALRVLWIRVMGPGDIHRSLTAFTTLYGVRWFHILEGPCVHGVNVIPCFLAGRSWFKTHERVCATVVESPGRIGLRTNPFSPDHDRLFRSHLCSVLGARGAVFDLSSAREPMALYVAEAEAEAEVIARLRDRYGIVVRPMRTEAESVVWPGNEMGHYSPIPGEDMCADLLELVVHLQRERAKGPNAAADLATE